MVLFYYMIQSDRERQAPTTIDQAEPTHLVRYQFARDLLAGNETVLDMPCGSGYGSAVLAERAKNVIGIDIFPDALEHGREFFGRPNIEFKVADMDALEISFPENELFDTIVSFEGIEHIHKQRECLEQCHRLLKPNGTLIMSTPRKPHGSPFHTIEFSYEEYVDFLSEFFTINEMYGQIYTDIFNTKERNENPHDYPKFNFIAICSKK